MATNWDREMQDKFDKLQVALTKVINEAITGQGEAFAKQSDALARQIDARATATEERLTRSFAVGMEGLREVVKTTADNYGGVLDGLRRDLGDFRNEWRDKTADTDRVLADHNQRLGSLEGAVFPNRAE